MSRNKIYLVVILLSLVIVVKVVSIVVKEQRAEKQELITYRDWNADEIAFAYGDKSSTASEKDTDIDLSQSDKDTIKRIYGSSPFRLQVGETWDMLQLEDALRKAGYHVDAQLSKYKSDGIGILAFQLKHSKEGYEIAYREGKIIYIRLLRDYRFFLESVGKGRTYSAWGVKQVYLPNLHGEFDESTPLPDDNSYTQGT